MIENYIKHQDLIKKMPVDSHGEKILKKNWVENLMTKRIFGTKEEVFITRREIRDEVDNDNIEVFLIKSIMWGYPSGRMNIKQIDLSRLVSSDLVEFYKEIKGRKELKWGKNGEEFLQFNGLKLSTVSKFLYFLNIKIDNHFPLILDLQIIQRLKETKFRHDDFDDLNYDNAPRNYMKYLELMNTISKKIDTKPENVEMFLFLFGKIL